MDKLESSKDYLKYTLTLAGIGFVYASQALGDRATLFGHANFFGLAPLFGFTHVRLLVGLMLLLFFFSSVAGILAFSGIIRFENEMAAVAPPAPSPPPTYAGYSGGTAVAISATAMSIAGPDGSTVVMPPPDPPSPPAPFGAEAARDAARAWGGRHLSTLLLGFLLAAVFFFDAFANPAPDPQRCTLTLPGAPGTPGAVLSFDCKADVAAAVTAAGGDATAP